MSQHSEFQIEHYRHDHDAGLAEMWNASDQQWPGGFTKGVSMTTERVADWMDKQVTVLRLVVVAPTEEVVAYGSLWDEPSQPGRTCYVDLLNVHPDYQGRSLCRRMLTQMLETATERGYQRMTLGTWPANLKAVPLYKKVGFFWKPNTTVSMESYIPMLRRLPILQEFFAQADWYSHYDRQLQQVEDEQRHPKTGETEVYVCRWRRPDGDWIEAVIDRKAQTLTGLETSEFAAFAHLAESKPAQGISYPITWEISNKRATPLSVRLTASGDAHVQIDQRADFTLLPGETRTITAAYRCAADAPQLEFSQWRPQPTPQIKTLLVLDEEELSLGSGLHYAAAAEITSHPMPITLMPGLTQRVLVQIKNHLDRAMAGELQIVTAEGVTAGWQRIPFQAEAKGYASAELSLRAEQAGDAALALVAHFTDDGQTISTAPQSLPVLVRSVGNVAAAQHQPDPSKHTIYFENDFFFAGCDQKEGRVWLSNKAHSDYTINLIETLGPPYTPNEFDQKNFQLSLTTEPGRLQITSSITSANFAGLVLQRQLTISASPLVEVRYWLHNQGDSAHKCQILSGVNMPDSFATNGEAALPRRERLVTELANVMPELEGDFPKKPDGLSEQWAAVTMNGQVHGVVWGNEIVEHEWRPWYFDLIWAENTIPAGEQIALPPLYLYCGPGDWRTVRRIWQQFHGQTQQAQLAQHAMPQASAAQVIALTPNPLLTLDEHVTLQLQADNLRQQPIGGRLLLTPPAGWRAEQQEFALEEVQYEKPFTTTLALHASNPAIGAHTGEVLMETTGFDRRQPFTILRVGDRQQQVAITQATQQGQAVWQIDNGRMAWTIAPDFHAGVIAWRERGSETNHLYSAFPEDGEFKWMKPWFGGIRPILISNEGGFPGKFEREDFVASAVAVLDQQGLPWQGVRLQAEIAGVKSLKGVRAMIDYLTLPGSNLLKTVYQLINDAPIYRHGWNPLSGLMIFSQVDGDYEHSTLYANSPFTDEMQRKRTPYNVWVNAGNWAAIVNPHTGRALSVSCASHAESIMLLDSAEKGGHLMVKQPTLHSPHGVQEMVVYAALVDSLAEARTYGSIGQNLGDGRGA